MNSFGTTLDQTRPILPVRLLNGCGALLDKSPIPRTPLRAVDVIATAKRRCGLDDFGGGDFFEGLSRLLDSCQREAQLNLIGRIVLRADLIRTLCSRVYTQRDQGVSTSRATGDSRTAFHRRLASQRYDGIAHLARIRSPAPS